MKPRALKMDRAAILANLASQPVVSKPTVTSAQAAIPAVMRPLPSYVKFHSGTGGDHSKGRVFGSGTASDAIAAASSGDNSSEAGSEYNDEEERDDDRGSDDGNDDDIYAEMNRGLYRAEGAGPKKVKEPKVKPQTFSRTKKPYTPKKTPHANRNSKRR